MTTRIVLLGTGTPNPDPKRVGPSVAIIVDKSVYLVDFGPGVVRRAVEAGITPSQLTYAFLTHLHSDHTSGYADLILTPAVVGRNVPLNVYGPKGLKSMTNHILAAYEEDIKERIDGLEPTSRDGYVVNTYEIPENTVSIVYQDDNVKVEAFPVNHGSWPAYGFKFSTPDKTVVISGDTAPIETIVEMARNCDVLIHEVYSAVSLQNRPPEWREYHSAMHTSSYELAEIASQAKPKLLVLYHQLSWGRTHDELLVEVGERYDGEVVSGKDLDCF
ncbi:MAG: MBL fold metallo-hydrolase [Candidatus Thorarchaeota archaeon]